jgi:hypothetical protein
VEEEVEVDVLLMVLLLLLVVLMVFLMFVVEGGAGGVDGKGGGLAGRGRGGGGVAKRPCLGPGCGCREVNPAWRFCPYCSCSLQAVPSAHSTSTISSRSDSKVIPSSHSIFCSSSIVIATFIRLPLAPSRVVMTSPTV